MKKFLNRYFPAIPVLLILIPMMFSHSCANTTQAPTGGKRDTIPPVITAVSPAMGSCNVKREGQQFTFTFNEYVTIKNRNNIFLSPPLKKLPVSKVKGKSVVVSFDEPLDSNTTYTISFTDAIGDNNEGNMFPGFTYVFSTGESIDSLYITGIVQDCNTLMPTKGATVMLYKSDADSAIFKERPFAAAKTDDWGFFCIRNIPDTTYRLYAVLDDNNDNIYDPETETVAFMDTAIVPHLVVADSIPELMNYEMKDTVNCLARKTEFELNLFKEKNAKQAIRNKARLSDRTSYISFMAPNAHIDTMWISGIKPECLITQFNPQRDSLEIWVNDRRAMPDTFHVFLNYLKTDTLGVLSSFTEEVKLPHPLNKLARKSAERNLKKEDTTCIFKLEAKGETIEQRGFSILFDLPIIYENFDSMKFWAVNPRQQEEPGTFKVVQDSVNIKQYYVVPDVTYMPGYEYFLKVPHRAFRDINGHFSDSTEVKVSLPSDEKLSSITLSLSNVSHRYIIDLLNEQRTNIIRTLVVDTDGDIVFPYLQAAKYCIRMTEDINANSLVDTGDLLMHKQPEKVKFYKLQDDSFQIEVKESMEIIQSIDMKELFK